MHTGVPPRVFVSYAHDDEAHQEAVRSLWTLLRTNGVDARLDVIAATEPQDWPLWMGAQLRECDFVLLIGSPEYRRRAEGRAGADQGRGVQWEARLIRELLYADQSAGRRRVLSVLLPGRTSDDLPDWMTPASSTTYRVADFSIGGVEALYRVLTGQPAELEPELGERTVLPPRGGEGRRPDGLRTEVVVRAEVADGLLATEIVVAGTSLGRRAVPVPADAWRVWESLRAGPAVAVEQMATTGLALGRAVFDDAAAVVVADLVNGLRPGDGVDVVLAATGLAGSMPIELLRVPDPRSAQVPPPLALRPGVTVARRLGDERCSPALPGPLKVLAAVAAPYETLTTNAPLDVEAEMQAVLGAVSELAGHPNAQVRILEVASLEQIAEALRADRYHVLHLSAHGSPRAIELENEDGAPVEVTALQLMDAVRRGGQPVPLIVLSACSGAATASEAMATELVRRGGDRVIAMQAPVTDRYATRLAEALYAELAGRPTSTVGPALAAARWTVEQAADDGELPEYATATLVCAGSDGPLVDPTQEPVSLSRVTSAPSGDTVRELSVGQLIGRRRELRAATAVVRRTPAAVEKWGMSAGVQLTGIGGIGKTALAGRVMARMREVGWLVAVHEGNWAPQALFTAVALELRREPQLQEAAEALLDAAVDDYVKLDLVLQLLAQVRLLLVFDDFERNLSSPGGDAFIDEEFAELFRALFTGARTGAVLVTCRYPVPGAELDLVDLSLPGLSDAELGRFFLRLPAIRDLPDPDERRLIRRAIGGHPRLIEFVDALIRGRGAAGLREVQEKLRDLARREKFDLRRPRPADEAIDAAMVLGSADILLQPLLGLLADTELEVLEQIAVSRAPMTIDDLTFAIDDASTTSADTAQVLGVVERLAALTLVTLTAGNTVSTHPWTAQLIAAQSDETRADHRHQRALAMRYRRFEKQRGEYLDLVEIPRHLSHLRRYDDLFGVAKQAIRSLPGTLATTAYLAEIGHLIPETDRAWVLLSELHLQALISVGDLTGARLVASRIHDRLVSRSAAEPLNTGWQRDLSVSHNNIGDLATAAGDLTTARTAYQASLDIAARLATADPTNTGWQRDLSVSHDKIGNLATAAGDLTTARTAYQASLDIAARLATADPTNTGWQRDLSISHDKIGNLATAAGDLTTARTAYQASLDIAARLATADPTNTGWQRDLSVSHDKIGNLATAAGDLTTARTAYQASLDIRQRLATADPTNTGWQRDLSVSHDKIGNLATAAGDLTTARTAYQASLDIAARLATADPTNTGWQRDLSISHEKIGNLATAAGDLTTARTAYQASLDIAARLATADPTNTEWQRDLSVSHNNIGDLATAAGDLTTARTAYQASLDIRQRLATADPTNTGWQRDLSISHDKIGDLATAAGDLTTARTAYQASLDIAARLATADPTNTGWQRDLSVSHNKIGDLATAAGDLTTARTAYQASLDIRQRLATADPTNAQWQRDLEFVKNRLEKLDQ